MDKKLKTKSVCPVCLKVVDAEYMEKNNMEKENDWNGFSGCIYIRSQSIKKVHRA